MAGVYRRLDNHDRRRSSDYYDRRDDRERTSRDVDYRDRTSDRFHRSPPEPSSRRGSYERDESVRSRDRDRDRDSERDNKTAHEYSVISPVERSLSRNSSNAFDQGQYTLMSEQGHNKAMLTRAWQGREHRRPRQVAHLGSAHTPLMQSH